MNTDTINIMSDTIIQNVIEDLHSDRIPLKTDLVKTINSYGVEGLDWWHSWKCDENYDINIYDKDEYTLGVAVYATWFDGEHIQTDINKIVAETSLDKVKWRAIASQTLHHVELLVTLRIAVDLSAYNAEQAIKTAYNRFNEGDLDIMHALEHCTAKAVITDDFPKIGKRCFNVNVLETRSKDFQVYADSSAEAEDLVRNHLHTHVVLTTDDSIGYDMLAVQQEMNNR